MSGDVGHPSSEETPVGESIVELLQEAGVVAVSELGNGFDREDGDNVGCVSVVPVVVSVGLEREDLVELFDGVIAGDSTWSLLIGHVELEGQAGSVNEVGSCLSDNLKLLVSGLGVNFLNGHHHQYSHYSLQRFSQHF